MADPINDPEPNTFVAFDLADGRRLVGAFRGWVARESGPTLELEAPNGAIIHEPAAIIVAGWWAPLGYRPNGGI